MASPGESLQARSLSQALLPEFDSEMRKSRRHLERIPEDKLDFKPHPKSMSMDALASHLADMAGWTVMAIDSDSLDIAPPGAPPYQPWRAKSRQELLDKFDQNAAAARAAIEKATDEHMGKNWTLLAGGRAIFSMPRIAVIRDMVISHSIHHRAQLGVYLRLNDVPVPATYGPSADEGNF